MQQGIVFQLSLLPNSNGFRFTGIKHDGTEAHCIVVRKSDGCHVIMGEAKYYDLKGWKAKALSCAHVS